MEELYKKLEEINNKLRLIETKIDETYKRSINQIENKKELYNLYKESSNLIKEKEKIEEDIYFLGPPIKTNGVIDLRIAKNNKNETPYLICLHDSRTVVGEITYRSYHFNEYFGDMGGHVFEEYRGNNYLYQALVLFSEKLYEEGVPNIWFSVNDYNIPSIKTIQKLNPKIIKQERGVTLFECKTRKREDNLTPLKK